MYVCVAFTRKSVTVRPEIRGFQKAFTRKSVTFDRETGGFCRRGHAPRTRTRKLVALQTKLMCNLLVYTY